MDSFPFVSSILHDIPTIDTGSSTSFSPGGTTHFYTPECNNELKPYVGQSFPNLELAIQFYTTYAKSCGFSIRVESTKRCKDVARTVIWKYLCCTRKGFKSVSPYAEFNPTSENVMKRRRASNRCGCEANIRLRYAGNDGYRVTKLDCRHNHPMLKLSEMVFSKENRAVTSLHQEFIMNYLKPNVGVTKSFRVYKNLVGSYANVGATVVDFNNFYEGLNSYMIGSDAQMVINDFFKKKEICDAFYFDYDVNKEDQLSRLFWCDPINRKSFSYFGDVVSVDATYQLNRYNMIFIPFTGVDNHKRSITFAAALLLHEDIESYVYLFQKFKKAMGHEPHVIITDQDASVKAAVERVFTGSVYRLCMWHIMMKVVNKVKFPPRTCPSFIESFHKKFDSIVWSNELSPVEFENRWFSVVEEFGLQGHEWLCVMFELRRYWIPSFFQKIRMSGLLRTTSRISASWSKKFDMDSSTRTPRMKAPLQIKKNCAAIYTINVFYEVQDEFMSGTYHCTLHELKKEVDIHYYQVQDELGRICKVQHLIASNHFQCSCNKFLKLGLPCCHIFMALKNCQAIDLPPSLINTRWTNESILQPIFEIDGAIHDSSAFIDEKMCLLAEVMTEMYSCVDVVSENVEKLKEFLCLLKEQKTTFNSFKIVDPSASTSSKKFVFEKFIGALPNEVSVHPPQQANNKFKEKRLRSGQGVEIENSKKKKRMCRICKNPGHNIQTCPQFVD